MPKKNIQKSENPKTFNLFSCEQSVDYRYFYKAAKKAIDLSESER